jgi:prepilin-type N-terminal cleavage/methylation domain-containing protein
MLQKHMSIFSSLENKKAFTLIESLIAISILLSVSTFPISQLAENYQRVRFAEETIRATLLAQEGIELARAHRDSQRLVKVKSTSSGSGQSELHMFKTRCQNEQGCILELTSSGVTINNCTGQSCPKLKYNQSTGQYGYISSWTDSPYIRVIRLGNQSSSNQEEMIISTVSWRSQNGVMRSVETRSYLYNFQ